MKFSEMLNESKKIYENNEENFDPEVEKRFVNGAKKIAEKFADDMVSWGFKSGYLDDMPSEMSKAMKKNIIAFITKKMIDEGNFYDFESTNFKVR